MKFISIFSTLFFFLSCKQSIHEGNFPVNEHVINANSFIELKKEINYNNRFKLVFIEDERILINLSKSGVVLLFNLDKGTVKKIKTNFATPEIDAVRYEAENCQFIYQKILYNFNFTNRVFDTITKLPFDKNNFIIHNLYSENIFKYNSYFYLQYGDENGYNRLSKNGLLFFNKDTNFKLIETPKELNQKYIHYNDMCIDNIGNTFYYIYATTSKLHKINILSKTDSSTTISNAHFIPFDTTKLNDMKYIYDYTYATNYNIKLMCTKDYIYLVQRLQKNKKTFYKLYQYDKDLHLKSEISLRHPVDVNFIFLVNNKINFISFKDKKIYDYEVE